LMIVYCYVDTKNDFLRLFLMVAAFFKASFSA